VTLSRVEAAAEACLELDTEAAIEDRLRQELATAPSATATTKD
jgi:hypothetical protein